MLLSASVHQPLLCEVGLARRAARSAGAVSAQGRVRGALGRPAPRRRSGVISGTSSPGTGPAPSAKLTMYASVPTCARRQGRLSPLAPRAARARPAAALPAPTTAAPVRGPPAPCWTHNDCREAASAQTTPGPPAPRPRASARTSATGPAYGASEGRPSPAAIASMDRPMPPKESASSCLRPARSISEAATTVPTTFVTPTAALASAALAMPACARRPARCCLVPRDWVGARVHATVIVRNVPWCGRPTRL